VKDPLEEALQRMKPAEMPPALMARLTAARPQPRELTTPAPAGWGAFFRRWLIPLTAGTCAAVATVAWLRNNDTPTVTQPPLAQNQTPYERNDFLTGARDRGVVVAPDQKPYRLMEVEWSEEDTVRPKADGSAIRVETKRRAVVPVPLEVF
jgi:hypothetical protein